MRQRAEPDSGLGVVAAVKLDQDVPDTRDELGPQVLICFQEVSKPPARLDLNTGSESAAVADVVWIPALKTR